MADLDARFSEFNVRRFIIRLLYLVKVLRLPLHFARLIYEIIQQSRKKQRLITLKLVDAAF